jgi:outer membrane protein assembly factor BamB
MLDDQKTTVFLDASTGRETQRFSIGNALLMSGPAIYTCSIDGVRAYDARSGKQLWQSANAPGCVLAVASAVLIAQGDGVISALRVADGSRVWQASEDVESSNPAITGDTVLVSTPAIQYKNIKGALIARRLSAGALLWRKTMGDYSDLYGAADNIALATNDGAIVALRVSDGAQLWSFPQSLGDPYVVALDSGVVFLRHENSSQIMALDLHTGALYWQASV